MLTSTRIDETRLTPEVDLRLGFVRVNHQSGLLFNWSGGRSRIGSRGVGCVGRKYDGREVGGREVGLFTRSVVTQRTSNFVQ
jgi:hypothetical protein